MKTLLVFAACFLLLLAPSPTKAQARSTYADEHAEPACVRASRHSSCPISAEMSDDQIRRCVKLGVINSPPPRPARARKRGEASATARAN